NDGPTGVISSYRYIMDPAGNRLRVVEDTGRTDDYTYDPLYRLTEEKIADPAAGNRTIDYTYDPVGNRITRTDSAEGTTSYVYDADDRLLTETLGGQVTGYTYDANGNTLTKDGPTGNVAYTWDAESRLVGVDTDGNGSIDVTNRYDAD